MPGFIRTLVPVTASATINGSNHTCTYYVTPDYLAVGTDADYFLSPMTPLLAQRLCDALACTLPTRKMVNQIWTNAAVKMPPQSITASPQMTAVPVFADHNFMVRTQRNLATNALGALVSGNKKDVVISAKIYTNFSNGITKPVVIYGWHYTSGTPIQPLSNFHEETYVDYSHGARLVQNAVTFDGAPGTITLILTDPNLAGALSDEGAAEGTAGGVILIPRYGGAIPSLITTHPRSQRHQAGRNREFHRRRGWVLKPELSLELKRSKPRGQATNATLMITNLQPDHAGNYAAVVSNNSGVFISRPAWLRITTNAYPIVFTEDFEVNTSTNWNVYWGAANGVPDYTVQWNYPYTAVPYVFHGATNQIPASPNSLDSPARAVRFTVNNNDAVAATAGVNMYPKGQSFSGNFALKCDMWLNYPGPPGGSAGSTEFAIFGLNHFGTQVNWAAASGTSSDGLWFASRWGGGHDLGLSRIRGQCFRSPHRTDDPSLQRPHGV